jgi:hypothetical protein
MPQGVGFRYSSSVQQRGGHIWQCPLVISRLKECRLSRRDGFVGKLKLFTSRLN